MDLGERVEIDLELNKGTSERMQDGGKLFVCMMFVVTYHCDVLLNVVKKNPAERHSVLSDYFMLNQEVSAP